MRMAAWGKKETWYKIDMVGDERSKMEELDDSSPSYLMQQPLGESDDVRRIKEEWTRLQVEADGLTTKLLQDAEDIRGNPVEQREVAGPANQSPLLKRAGPVKWQDVNTLPRVRLPSMDSRKDPVATFPSINMRSSLRKNILEMRTGDHYPDIQPDRQEVEPPQCVTLEKTTYEFGVDTPTQTDINWCPPANAAPFKLLMYDIEVDSGHGWETLTESRLPILRVYFTSEKIIMGRFSRVQEPEPVGVRLRLRASGRVKCETGEETLKGPWSDEIWLTIEGSEVLSNTAI